jgi:uncharacterized small protein (DUF1192 family)
MDTDDLEPTKPKSAAKNLEEMSIEALTDYIAGLEAEIDCARQAISGKEKAQASAESVFKS